jgi:hypothetical protein
MGSGDAGTGQAGRRRGEEGRGNAGAGTGAERRIREERGLGADSEKKNHAKRMYSYVCRD